MAVNGGAAGRQRVGFAPCKLAGVSPLHALCSLTPSASEQACGKEGRWPCTLLSRIHWHPKTLAKGARLTYAPTDAPAIDTCSEKTPVLTHTYLLAAHGFRDKYTQTQICKGNSSSLKASTAGHTVIPDGLYAHPQHLGGSP